MYPSSRVCDSLSALIYMNKSTIFYVVSNGTRFPSFFFTRFKISSLSLMSCTKISVNFALTFSGSSFFPMSFPGFIHPMSLKFSCLLISFKSPLSYKTNDLPSIIGSNFCSTSLLARLISSISTQSPCFIALIKFPSTKWKAKFDSILSLFALRFLNFFSSFYHFANSTSPFGFFSSFGLMTSKLWIIPFRSVL